MELLAQATGFVEVFLDVIAVGAEHHKLTALDQIAQAVGHQFPAAAVATHRKHALNVLVVHGCNGLFGEGPQEVPARAWGQQQTPLGVLHGAVVGQGSGIKPDAVEPHLAGRQLLHTPADCAGVQALVEEGIAHAGKPNQRFSCAWSYGAIGLYGPWESRSSPLNLSFIETNAVFPGFGGLFDFLLMEAVRCTPICSSFLGGF